MDDQKLAVLRTVDKVDKIGVDGVIELLQKPFTEFGAHLDPVRAAFIGQFLAVSKQGDLDNEGVLDALRQMADRASLVGQRLEMMATLEETILEGSVLTAWDYLLALPANADETWKLGGRPANIAWALDDLSAVARQRAA